MRIAIKSLNIGISKDPYGIPNEILKEGIAGNGLIKALVVLMNKIKDNPKDYPEAMNLCNEPLKMLGVCVMYNSENWLH